MKTSDKNFICRFIKNDQAASAAEFALVLPLLLLFVFGIIDVGRFMWEWNLAEKATQMGVRYAVVTDFVATDLEEHDFTSDGVAQGAPVNSTFFPGVTCTSDTVNGAGIATAVSCPCENCSFGDAGEVGPFNNIVGQMSRFYSPIQADNVTVAYEPSNLGFAGNPYGADVAPIVTVRLDGLVFRPLLGQPFNGTINMGSFESSLPMEDGVGIDSN